MKVNRMLVLCLTIILISPLLSGEKLNIIDESTKTKIKESLLKKYGVEQKFRIDRGVDQAANLWRNEDGSKEDFAKFCQTYFIGDEKKLDTFFKKMAFYSEIIGGYITEMTRDLRQPLDLDWGPITPFDMTMGRFNPFSHLTEDLFKAKIAFLGLLNFPRYSLEETTKLGPKWSRKEWAYARSAGPFSRTPAEINQKIRAITTNADTYIAQYNIMMGNLVDGTQKTFFPKQMKLITHWGLRDELKARYVNKNDLFKQKMIYRVMERIIFQDIPQKVINNKAYNWDPFTNKVYENGKEIEAAREPDTRYEHLLNVFKGIKMIDPYMPHLPTYILRKFEANREIPEKDIEAMFLELISSKQVKKVARLIQKRLNRKLYPFDIWYNGFKAIGSIDEEKLDKIVAEKYPTIKHFEKDIANILIKLGFSEESAKFIATNIQVDASRGAGHSAGAGKRGFKARLRTRAPKEGMNYKGFNVAIHELGHSVEQTLNLNKMDYYALTGVPNAGFTEAFAFIFQDRDLELLGIKEKNPKAKFLKALDIFWNAYEIMGVSLVDMRTWNWMYKNPDATPAQLKQAILKIATEIWNKYYAKIFGKTDQTILAIYSHMISYPLYLPDYPLGHVIQFQLEKYLEDKVVGKEMVRMCASGNIIPQLWMKNAVGSDISVKPLLQAVNEALKYVKN
jgi:hypothetical protein